MASNQDQASMQASKEIKEKSSISVNASQPSVYEQLMGIHPVEGKPPQPTQWKGNLHNPGSACTHWLGHRNTRTHAYWEITKSRQRCMRYPPTMLILENHSTVSLRLSTLIFLLQLQIPFLMIMIQGLSLSVKNAPTGLNGRMQYKRN